MKDDIGRVAGYGIVRFRMFIMIRLMFSCVVFVEEFSKIVFIETTMIKII